MSGTWSHRSRNHHFQLKRGHIIPVSWLIPLQSHRLWRAEWSPAPSGPNWLRETRLVWNFCVRKTSPTGPWPQLLRPCPAGAPLTPRQMSAAERTNCAWTTSFLGLRSRCGSARLDQSMAEASSSSPALWAGGEQRLLRYRHLSDGLRKAQAQRKPSLMWAKSSGNITIML